MHGVSIKRTNIKALTRSVNIDIVLCWGILVACFHYCKQLVRGKLWWSFASADKTCRCYWNWALIRVCFEYNFQFQKSALWHSHTPTPLQSLPRCRSSSLPKESYEGLNTSSACRDIFLVWWVCSVPWKLPIAESRCWDWEQVGHITPSLFRTVVFQLET